MRIPLTLSTLLLASASFAQQTFPSLHGETAKGKSVQLPPTAPKEYTIIGLAYSQSAQPALEEWFEPAYLRFVAKHGLFAGAYDCDVYFVPLFTGLNKAAYEPSLKKFRKSASPEIVQHVVFCKAELDELRQALGLVQKDVPYFFVLDREGHIVYRTQGDFTEEKMEEIEEVLLR